MRNLTLLTVAFMVAALFGAPVAEAQVGTFSGLEVVGPLSGSQTGVNTGIALWIKYNGSSTGTIEVDATTGDIELEAAGAVDATVSCPEADLDGVIDVSDASCNTWIEVVDAINMGGSNWSAVLGPVDSADAPGDNLLVLAETDEYIRVGRALYLEADVDGALAQNAVVTSIGLYPPGAANEAVGQGTKFHFSGASPNRNPFGKLISVLTYFSLKQTSTGTIADTIIRAVKREYVGNRTNGFDLQESNKRIVWQETGGATTADNINDFSNFPLISNPGEVFLLETGSSTDQSVVINVVAGALLQK